MTVELLQTLSLIAYVLAAVMLVIAGILFFFLKVPKLISDLSGATARKAINQIRQQNEESGDKAYKPSHVNLARGKVTDKISASGRLKRESGRLGGHIHMGTQKFATRDLAPNPTEVIEQPAAETVVLDASAPAGETVVLDAAAPAGETAVLETGTVPMEPAYYGETAVLEPEMQASAYAAPAGNVVSNGEENSAAQTGFGETVVLGQSGAAAAVNDFIVREELYFAESTEIIR